MFDSKPEAESVIKLRAVQEEFVLENKYLFCVFNLSRIFKYQ